MITLDTIRWGAMACGLSVLFFLLMDRMTGNILWVSLIKYVAYVLGCLLLTLIAVRGGLL